MSRYFFTLDEKEDTVYGSLPMPVSYGVPLVVVEVFVVLWGLLWGSFLNVVIYRLPRGENVVLPSSYCPSCRTPIPFYRNIPVFSFLYQKGRTRCCNTIISSRYLVVEIVGGLISLVVFEYFVKPYIGSQFLGKSVGIFLMYFAICMIVLASTFTDLEWMIIPDSLNYLGTVIGLLTAPWHVDLDTTFSFLLSGRLTYGSLYLSSLLSAFLPAFGLFLFTRLYQKIRGINGIGLGDLKFMLLAGAWLGFKGGIFVCMAGAIQSSLAVLLCRLLKISIPLPKNVEIELNELRALAQQGDTEAKAALEGEILLQADDSLLKTALPLGPFLALGFYEYLFFRASIDELIWPTLI